MIKQDKMLNLNAIYYQDAFSIIQEIAFIFYKSRADKKILASTLAFSAGFNPLNGDEGPSQSDLAKELGVSRSLINHHIKNWNKILGLP